MADVCTDYRLIIETTTIRLPRFEVVSEDCTVPATCCTEPAAPVYICTDEELVEINSDEFCGLNWYTNDTVGFDYFTDFDTEMTLVQLPPRSVVVSTACHVLECGDDFTGADCTDCE